MSENRINVGHWTPRLTGPPEAVAQIRAGTQGKSEGRLLVLFLQFRCKEEMRYSCN
jgi:hypothetical protein